MILTTVTIVIISMFCAWLSNYLRSEVWAPNMGPYLLGDLKGTHRVYSRYIRIPGLRAHAVEAFAAMG